MNFITELINQANYILWTYILVAMLLGCALWFSFKTRFVQFRMISEMVRLLGDSTAKIDGHEKHISSFQAFTISLASRVGTGNLAGVATAITVGGPGAIFWMWVIALLGASSAFVESTLAQLFKVRSKHSYIGGPAYYMEKGLKKRWMGVIFAILITITFGFAFNSVQSNTICAAFDSAFNIPPIYGNRNYDTYYHYYIRGCTLDSQCQQYPCSYNGSWIYNSCIIYSDKQYYPSS